MGVYFSLMSQSWPPKSHFSVDDIPDLTGRVIIVTGANAGVGKETAKALLAKNAKVYIAARNQDKATVAIGELKEQTGHEAIFLKLNLDDLSSVKAAAEEFLSKEKELHILFNNAGVMAPPVEQVTSQNYDLQFGTNVLGHFYFTKLLIPALLAGTSSSSDGTVRVVNTSSSGAYFANGALDFNTMNDGPARRKQSSFNLYCYSKLGNVLIANEFARRYGDQGVISSSCNPGNLKTELQRHMGSISHYLLDLTLYHPSYGALTQLWAGASPEGRELNGQFLIPWARRASYGPQGANDENLSAELWKWCEEQVEKHV